MAIKLNPYNYSDESPQNLREFQLANSMDQESFNLFGVKTIYYKFLDVQGNFDPVYRDLLSSKEFDEPLEVRSFFKVDEATEHGMTDIGIGQLAERKGNVWFNIDMVEFNIGREPYIGDVLEYLQLAQKFEIYKISKETHRQGRAIRYNCSVRLYQDTR